MLSSHTTFSTHSSIFPPETTHHQESTLHRDLIVKYHPSSKPTLTKDTPPPHQQGSPSSRTIPHRGTPSSQTTPHQGRHLPRTTPHRGPPSSGTTLSKNRSSSRTIPHQGPLSSKTPLIKDTPHRDTLIKDHTQQNHPSSRTTLITYHPQQETPFIKDHPQQGPPLTKVHPLLRTTLNKDQFCLMLRVVLTEGFRCALLDLLSAGPQKTWTGGAVNLSTVPLE